jgi:hypothetical protein
MKAKQIPPKTLKKKLFWESPSSLGLRPLVWLYAADLFRKKCKRKYDSNAFYYISLFENKSGSFLEETLLSRQKFAEQTAWIQSVVLKAKQKKIKNAVYCIGVKLCGTEVRFDAVKAAWVREMSREMRKIAGGGAAIAHQPQTLEELEFVSRLDTVNVLDVTAVWRANFSPENAFRAASSSIRFNKPVILHLDSKCPQAKIGKMLWSALAGGAWGVVLREDSKYSRIFEKERKRIHAFLSQYKKLKKTFLSNGLLKAGAYHARKMSEGEYFFYSPYGGRITIDCKTLRHPVLVRWYNPLTGKFLRNDISFWKRDLALKAPFSGPAAIYLRQGQQGAPRGTANRFTRLPEKIIF